MKKEKYLFIIDLDGTILKDSSTCVIHPKTLIAIKKLKKLGHIICIATGRPWRSVKNIYNQLELDTVIANHNGAHIHHPSSDTFVSRVRYIELNILMYILGDINLKKLIKNYAIQGIEWVQIKKSDLLLENMFGFNTLSKYSVGINLNKVPMKPIGAILDLNDNANIIRLGDYLKRKYGDLADFSHWPRGGGQMPIFEISPIGAKKNVALSYLSRFYHIKNKNIIAIGDGWNDIDMFQVAGVSVAMENSQEYVKQHANYITKLPNTEGGVGEFINKFLENPSKFLNNAKIKKIIVNNKKNIGGYH